MNQCLVTIRTKFDTIQVTMGANGPDDAARVAQLMYPGSLIIHSSRACVAPVHRFDAERKASAPARTIAITIPSSGV